jgi:hypothetical protein
MDDDKTVIPEVSAIQVKLMYVHFRSIKINDDIMRINSHEFSDPTKPDAIKKKGELAYCIIDIIALFENYNSLVRNIYNYENIEKHLNSNLKFKLENIRKITAEWKHVRNKIGGHVDIKLIREFCEENNYNGVFISNEIEADFKGVLILQMIESAINSTLFKSHLFDSNLKLTEPAGLRKLVNKIMMDWKPCLALFNDVSEFLYSIGKKDKLKRINKEDIGLIKF